MYVSARADYGMCAVIELARVYSETNEHLVTSETIAREQGIPSKFLEGILRELRQANIVLSRRGPEGGYRLAKPPQNISVADVIRALDGPLAAVRGQRPEDVDHADSALSDVWIALRASMRSVLENITLDQAISGDFNEEVSQLINAPGARARRSQN
ncbi:MAG: Rrf2 family transcriptional regulator [Candidatus Nanopelagicales bacterium]|jgi:Rrf2 family protein